MDTTYKAHWKKCLLDKELAKLQEYLNTKHAQINRYHKMNELLRQRKELNEELCKLVRRKIKTEEQLARIEELKPILDKLWNEYYDLKKKPVKVVNKIVCACPSCPSFIIKPEYKCTTCHIKICKACREIQKEGHVCNPDTVESVKLLKKDTKACPKCATQIHKLDGCDQMWCVSCHTTFSWKTGEIDNKRIHNPHYFDWLRKTGQQLQPVPGQQCLNNPVYIFDRVHMTVLRSTYPYAYDNYISIRQVYYNLQDNIQKYTRYMNNTQHSNDLLEQHIHQQTTKDAMATLLLRRDNMREKYSEIIQLIDMIKTVYVEVIGSLDFNTDFYKAYLHYMKPIISYANEHFIKLSIVYKWSFPFINVEGYVSTKTFTTKELKQCVSNINEIMN
jgi:hypothetical protein